MLFVFLAFASVWILLFLFAFRYARRQARLEAELEELRRQRA